MSDESSKDKGEQIIQLDLNCPTFIRHWLALPDEEKEFAFGALVKLYTSTWDQITRDPAFNWMQAASIPPPVGHHAVFTIRLTRKTKAIVLREDNFMRMLVLQR